MGTLKILIVDDESLIVSLLYQNLEMQDGAHDFIDKPIDEKRLPEVVKHAMEKCSLILENRSLSIVIKSGIETKIIGNSPLIDELRKNIVSLADTEASVLVFGENGTGKELVAKCLHDFSSRNKYYFVPINCCAIPEAQFEAELFGHEKDIFPGAPLRIGKLENAHQGTVFFDEIDSMPISFQGKLLRVLQDHIIYRIGSNKPISVDFRVVASTKADLKTEVENGRFREDLYYRLNVFPVSIPPLRKRREDIPLLFNHFIAKHADHYKCGIPQLSRSDINELMAYSWSGNVRELNNIAERYIINLKGPKGPVTIKEILHSSAKYHSTLPEQVAAFERGLIVESLRKNKGNIGATAEDLGIPRRTLNEKIRKYNIRKEEYLG